MAGSSQSQGLGDPYDGLQSGPSLIQSFVRFYNKTNRIIDVYWVNYQSQHIRYITLNPNGWYDIATFVGHPWVFRDCQSGLRLITLPDRQFVFFPPAPRTEQVTRRVVVVGTPRLSLQNHCVHVLRSVYQDHSKDAGDELEDYQEVVSDLEIPVHLREELRRALTSANEYYQFRLNATRSDDE